MLICMGEAREIAWINIIEQLMVWFSHNKRKTQRPECGVIRNKKYWIDLNEISIVR